MPEQRNRYKGTPERAWVRVELVAGDGTRSQMELMADTGSPCAIVLSYNDLQRFMISGAAPMGSNFGLLTGGWIQVVIADVGLDEIVLGYGSDDAALSVEQSDLNFAGLVGLPLLRLLDYGGNGEEFWIRPAS